VRRQDQAAVPAGAPPALRIPERHDPTAEVRAQVRAVWPHRIAVCGIPCARRVQSHCETLAAERETDAELGILARRIIERADHARALRDRDAAMRRELAGAPLSLRPRLHAQIRFERIAVELAGVDGAELLGDI